VTTRTLSALRAICPQCKRRRFIPGFTKPFCTPSCKRDADREAAVTAAPTKED